MSVRVELDDRADAKTPSGRAIPFAQVVVTDTSTASLATVYQATSGTAVYTTSGTLTADGIGRVEGFVNEGTYNLAYSSARYEDYDKDYEAVSGDSPGGRVLGIAQITTVSTLTGTTPGDGSVALYCNNVILGSRPVVVTLDAPFMHADTDLQVASIYMQYKTSAAAWSAPLAQMLAVVTGTASGTGAYNAASKVGRMPCHRDAYLIPTTDFTINTSYDFRIQLAAHAAGKVMAVYADDPAVAGLGKASLRVTEV